MLIDTFTICNKGSNCFPFKTGKYTNELTICLKNITSLITFIKSTWYVIYENYRENAIFEGRTWPINNSKKMSHI